MRQLFIPTIGSEITLAADWTFALFNEYRNDQMALYMGLDKQVSQRTWHTSGNKLKDITLPAGTVMKVDRIYIRKGAEDFDSVTFIVQQIPNVAIGVADEVYDYKKARQTGRYSDAKKTITRKKIRFWAKLPDVNTMFIK